MWLCVMYLFKKKKKGFWSYISVADLLTGIQLFHCDSVIQFQPTLQHPELESL